MTITSDPHRLFTERHDTYDRFIRAVLYPQGLRAFFLESNLLRPELRVLDAGCGTGVVTIALRAALVRRGVAAQSFHAFDLTPAMLGLFRLIVQRHAIEDVTLAQANVLHLSALPSGWLDYDLVVSASMLEYVEGYEASFGSYEVNEAKHMLTHHAQGSNTRDLPVGKDLPRVYQFTADGKLIIRSARPDEHWSVTWEHYRSNVQGTKQCRNAN